MSFERAIPFGAALAVIGYVGLFFARLIKAAVSRRREYLADASAVQFTRQTDGIAGALSKIGYGGSSLIQDPDAEEVSHMLFANGMGAFLRLYATHPPIEARIRALDPGFDPVAGIDIDAFYQPTYRGRQHGRLRRRDGATDHDHFHHRAGPAAHGNRFW